MTTADAIFMRKFAAILGALFAFGVIVFFVARHIGGNAYERMMNTPQEVEARIRPLAQVRVGNPNEVVAAAKPAAKAAAPAAAGGGNLSGEQVVHQVCSACHMTGVAGAPKIGDNAAWKPRYAQGMKVLLHAALHGLNAMPPRGGHPDLTDDEIHRAIVYMLGKSGIKAPPAPAPSAAQGAAQKVEAVASQATKAAGEAAQKVAQAAGAAAAAVKQAASSAMGTANADPAAGEGTVKQICSACHATGVAGAPKIGDKAEWTKRLKQGFDTLVKTVIHGKNAMPPKGGNPSLSEQDIRNAVAYILSKADLKP